jgi:hypothetical protein
MRAALLRAELYQQYARDCYRFASETNDFVTKNELLVMARAWVRLADQAEKNSRQDLVYETPSPPPQPTTR